MKRLRIPAWVLKTGRQAILHYLGGLFDTDGTVSGKAVLDWTTKDFVFAGQVAMAMKACGMDFNTELSWNKTYQKYYVRLRLTVGSSFLMKPYMKYAGKVSRLRPPIYESPKKDRFLVTKVLPAGVEKCVDISVEDSHIYLANGFVTHNTSNFALIYGGGPASIMRATGCDKMEATRRKAAFDGSVPTFSKWIKKQQISVKKDKGIWNPFSRWIAIPDIDIPDKKIMAACQRKAVNFPVQSAGADIMKISMILLCREFYKLGWLKQNNGDDSVRMLLTVHDEIVFEIKHERVQEALTVITTTMSSPTKIPGPPYSPKWKVPLVVEPLIGETWAGEYDYGMLMHGKPYKSGDKVSDMEIVVGDRVYHKVPPWLEGKFKPGYSVDGTVVEPAQPPPAEPTQPAASPVSVPAPQVSVAPPPVIAPPTMPTKQTSVQHKEPTRISGDLVFEHKLSRLTLKTVEDLAKICFNLVLDYDSPDARILHLVDNLSGETLISTSLDIRVIPNKFKALLREVNLY